MQHISGPRLMMRVSESDADSGVKSTCKSLGACYLHGNRKRSSCKYYGSINPPCFLLHLHSHCNMQACCVTNTANRHNSAENCCFFSFYFFKLSYFCCDVENICSILSNPPSPLSMYLSIDHSTYSICFIDGQDCTIYVDL